MAGIAFTIPAAATDLSLPKLLDHPEMAEGTVFLFDPNHAYGSFAGVPANAGVLPNVAGRNALPIIGGGAVLADLDGVINTVTEGASMMQLERTAKGAIHIMLSKVAMVTGTSNYIARLPLKIRQAIFDMIAQSTDGVHGVYFSQWFRTTRAGGPPNAVSWMHFATPVGVTPSIYSTVGGIISAGGNLGSISATHALGTANILGGGAAGWSGTKPGALGQVSALFAAGPTDAWTFGGNKNTYPSRAYYRAKVEFLHLNKRANAGAGGTLAEEFAAAVAADQAAFNAAFAAGGALNGDTFTDPATALP